MLGIGLHEFYGSRQIICQESAQLPCLFGMHVKLGKNCVAGAGHSVDMRTDGGVFDADICPAQLLDKHIRLFEGFVKLRDTRAEDRFGFLLNNLILKEIFL